jgi:hypothetical protein
MNQFDESSAAPLYEYPVALQGLNEFSEDFTILLAAYQTHESTRAISVVLELLEVGKRVRHGNGTWTKRDLAVIVRWKNIRPVISKTEIQDEEGGVLFVEYPVLASVLLTLTRSNVTSMLEGGRLD